MSYELTQWWSPNCTKGRGGHNINKIVLHHAATTNFNGIGATFQNTSRQTSAHFGVEPGHVCQYVSISDTAWHCLPLDKTEILTPDGFVYLSDIGVGDDVVAYDKDSGNLVVQQVKRVIEPREEEVICYREIEATPQHKFLAKSAGSTCFADKTWRDVVHGAQYALPKPIGSFGDGIDLSDDEIRYLVATQAEGSYVKPIGCRKSSDIVSFHFRKERKIARLRRIMENVGIQYREYHSSDGKVVFRTHGWVGGQLWCERWLEDKQFSDKFARMSGHQLDVFMSELREWDGMTNKNNELQYTTTSIVNANAVQLAIFEATGKSSRISKYDAGGNRKPIYTVAVHKNGTVSIAQNSADRMSKRTTLVSCVEVPAGYIVVRQNGLVFITGNCGNWVANQESIGIEHVNSTGAPNWDIADGTIQTGAELLANLAKQLGWNHLKIGENVFYHSDFRNTSCLPVDSTELLTKNGWKTLRDVKVGDEVATYRLDDKAILFSPVRYVVAPYEARTWAMPSRGIEATADHRMVWRTQRGVCKVTSLAEMARFNGRVYIPNAGFYAGKGIDLSDDEIRYLVAVQADGHYALTDYDKHNGRYCIDFHLAKNRKIKELLGILDRLGKDYRLTHCKNGTVRIKVGDKREVDWAEHYLHDKGFSWKFLEMNEHQAMVFLDTLLDFDGCRAGNDYSSMQRQNIDVVQAIASIHGIGTLVNKDGNRINFGGAERTVNYGGGLVQATVSGKAKRISNREVGCVTVDSGLILVRQFRRTTIVGNCPMKLRDAGLGQKEVDIANSILGAGKVDNPTPTPTQNPVSTPTASNTTNGGWLYFDYRGNVRNEPTTNSGVFATYGAGTWVHFDGYVHGQVVNGSDKWLRSTKSKKYVHESVVGGTFGLPDLGAVNVSQGAAAQSSVNRGGHAMTLIHDMRGNWRNEPNSHSGLFATYDKGARVACKGWVYGEDPYKDGNNKWVVSSRSGKYAWSGIFGGTYDLPYIG